jgi:hypothetical protein
MYGYELSRVVWRKSSRSANQATCVEVAVLRDKGNSNERDTIWLVRDSKDPSGPVLRFGSNAWAAFIASAKKDSGWP